MQGVGMKNTVISYTFSICRIEPYKTVLSDLKGNNRISDKRWENEIEKAEDYELQCSDDSRSIRTEVRPYFRKKMEEQVSPNTSEII